MALPDYAALSTGTPIVLADTTYNPSTNTSLGTRTDQINVMSLPAGSYRQSDKFDFGATWDMEVVLAAAIEWNAAPSAGETVDIYIGYSSSGTAAVGNPGGLSGVDGAYNGYNTNPDESVKQLVYLGSVISTPQASTTVQIDTSVSTFVPRDRYGILVVLNNAASAQFNGIDAEELAFRLTPIRTSAID